MAVDPHLDTPHFEIRRVLGEGGSGIVYEARSAAGERVALKVLRAELAPSQREVRRFLDEAERMQRVTHHGLVRLLEAGVLPDGRPYLAMPFLDGETLSERIARGPIPPRVAIAWAKELASAVEALHGAGMIHRDIKPENVLLVGEGDDDAHAVLLDFGIARDRDDDPTTTTVEGRVRGTPAYMAPERFFGASANVASDVYELAVLTYAMLVGRLPWGSEKDVTARLNPTSPREAGADVSPEIALVVLRALSTRPEKRPGSAAAFADALGEETTDANDGETRATAKIEVTQTPPVDPLRTTESMLAPKAAREQGRSGLVRIAMAATIALVAIGTVMGFSRGGHAPEPLPVVAFVPVAPTAPPRPTEEPPEPAASVAKPAPPPRPLQVPKKAVAPASATASAPSAPSSASVDKYFEDRR